MTDGSPSDTDVSEPTAFEVQVPVRYTLAFSVDAIRDRYIQVYDEEPSALELRMFVGEEIDIETIRDESTMCEIVDDEWMADYDSIEAKWSDSPMRLVDYDGNVLFADSSFEDWRNDD